MFDIVIIDNYDSFTFNLVHYIEAIINQKITVFRNNEFVLSDIAAFQKIIISPGPGLPDEAGLSKQVIRHYKESKAILGVCLGHQAIVEIFGGKLKNLPEVYHGRSLKANVVQDDILFQNLPKQFLTGRYHSWVADENYFPECLETTAIDDFGNIMALKHKNLNIRGVQFHPESIMTEHGFKMLENWIKLT